MLFFIVNPNSGSGRGADIWKKTEEYLKEHCISYELHLTEFSGQAKEISEQITEKNSEEEDTIIIIGGDGTLNEVISGLNVSTKMALGYIPAGSGNDFARSMKISHNPNKMLHKIIEEPEYKMIDYGIVHFGKEQNHTRRFCVSCGIGFDAAICHELIHSKLKKIMKKLHLTKLVYIIAGLHQIFTSTPVNGTIVLDKNEKVELKKMWFTACHIHSYEGGGFRFAPGADYTDGKLDICVINNVGRLKLVVILLGALLGGKHKKLKGFHQYTCKEVVFQMDAPMAVHTDGEEYEDQTHMTVSCINRKLKFIV